ncbi:MAG: sigma 54-interacting transcriptional regulator, partial [Candidatus Latescibacterota bacterium]|jgi:DNA-binding NtrC family response regulator/sugar lactone lactonase YvrE
MIVDRLGRVWWGGHQAKVHCWDGRALRAIEVGGNEGITRVPYEDSHGRLWVGLGEGGLVRVEDGRAGEPLAAQAVFVNVLTEDRDGRLWIGSHGQAQALGWFDGEQFHPVIVDGQDSCYVHALRTARDGTVWAGTGTGLLALRDGAWRRLTTADGLSENAVLALAQDAQDRLWVGTGGGGALCYDGETVQVFRLGDGAAVNIVEAVLVDSRGQVWFGTRAGLVAYRPGVVPPGIAIRQVIAGQVYRAPWHVTCPETVGEIRIAFQGIGFRTGPGQMRYSHRLLGSAQATWSAFTAAHEVSYTGLPAGEYRFEVRAKDRDGLCSPAAVLPLVITPDPRADKIEALQVALRSPDQPLIGQSPAMVQLLGQLSRVAATEMTVLILGETGTGKGLATRLIHERSRCRTGPFLHVNCGALPDGIITSELFGHEKGAFTGAVVRKLGRFELASGGTLFLDEIGDLPLESQRVLLQVLEGGSLQRVGGQATIRVDVRVVAATNRDLQGASREGIFREDLFYRLSGFVLRMPPLRQRPEDLPLLLAYFTERFCHHLGRPVPTVHPVALDRLQRYHWPGNIRELEHLVQRAVLLCRDGVIRPEDLALDGSPGPLSTEAGAWLTLDAYEEWSDQHQREYLRQVLEACRWVIYGDQGAARLLGTHPERLRARLHKLGLNRPA